MITTSKPLGHTGSHKDRQGTKGGGWGDNGAGRPTTEEYRSNYDNIDFSKSQEEKKTYRVKVNGKYVD